MCGGMMVLKCLVFFCVYCCWVQGIFRQSCVFLKKSNLLQDCSSEVLSIFARMLFRQCVPCLSTVLNICLSCLQVHHYVLFLLMAHVLLYDNWMIVDERVFFHPFLSSSAAKMHVGPLCLGLFHFIHWSFDFFFSLISSI